MRILLVMDPFIKVPPDHYGGIERVVADVANGLAAGRHDVTLWAAPGSKVNGRVDAFGVEGEWSRWSNARNTLTLTARFMSGAHRFDVVHNFGRLAYLSSILARDIPKVQTYMRPVTPGNMRLAARLGARRLHYTAVSAAIRDTGQPGGGDWSVIYNCAVPERYPFVASTNAADAPRMAPFQDWARDLFVYRQRNFLKDDPMFVNCLPPGGPRMFQNRYGFQFLEDRDRRRVFVMMGGGNRNWRLIYTDGREQKGQVEGDADNPLYFGRAVGRWEGEALVVDTKGFNERFWFANGGLPHTQQLHLVERFSRPDFDTLRYDVTIDDPGAYTRTWSAGWTLSWVPGEDMPEYFCQDNRP